MSDLAKPIGGKSSRLLVTGAGGFVGPYLIRAALKRYGSDSMIMACTRGVDKFDLEDSRLIVSQPDITDRQQLDQMIHQFNPTHIVHLAAISHVPTAMENPTRVWEVNVLGTLNLLEAVRHLAPQATFLFVSSSEIYGHSFLSRKPLDESAELQPANPYATTKAAGDLMAGQYTEYGLGVIRARPFNHIGPGQSHGFVVSAFASQIAAIEKGLQPPELKVGNLDAERDFTDVRDMVEAYLDLLDYDRAKTQGMAFNICSGTHRPIRNILEDLVSLSTAKFEIVIDVERLRPSDTPTAAGNASRIRELTGWKPQYEWLDTLQDVLENCRHTLSR